MQKITTQLHIYLFGEFRFYRDGVHVTSKDWHTSQACQLFKVLLTERGHVVSANKLTEMLWPEYSEHAHKTLRSAIHALRNVLEPMRAAQAPSHFVPRGQGGYQLCLPKDDSIWIDTIEFEHLLERAYAEPDSNPRHALFTQALQLYTGDYLPEDEEARWALFERTRLRECYLHATTTLMEEYMDEHCYDDAIKLGRRALSIDTSHEPLYRMLMRAQAGNGDMAGALQTFEQCRHVLEDTLGADPSPQTLTLHIALLRGELQAQAPPFLQERKQTKIVASLTPRPRKQTSAGRKRQAERLFVGRKAELQWLTKLLEQEKLHTAEHRPNIVAITGEAGIGKSFLLHLFLTRVRRQGILILSGACYALDQGMAFAPLLSGIRSWMHECDAQELAELPAPTLARLHPLLPELSVGRSDVELLQGLPAEQVYSMLVVGLVDILLFLCRKQRLVLAFDDLHWADEATLHVLHRLMQHIASAYTELDNSLLLIVSYRPEDTSENQPLSTFLRSLGRERRVATLPLARFTQEEVVEYLRLSHATPPLSSATLYQATQGNALFLAEAVRTLLEQPQQARFVTQEDTVQDVLQHSQQIRDVVLARATRLPQEALELLRVAALVGRPFPLALLQALSKNDDTIIDVLLERSFLVEADSDTPYEFSIDFVHETVRHIVASTCSTLQKRYIHSVIAEMLVSYYVSQREVYAAEIALHYQQGGQKLLQALYYRVLAGDFARRTFSYRQAIEHYNEALSLLKHLEQSQHSEHEFENNEWRRKVYSGKMLAHEALFDWEGMQACHRSLLAHSGMSIDSELVEISMHRLAVTRSLMGHLREAARMGQTEVRRLQEELHAQNNISKETSTRVDILLDITQRWLHLLLIDEKREFESEQCSSRFPPFIPAALPQVQDWNELKELLGATQAAFMFVEYGWALLLQGFQKDAEQCLLVALQAAEQTHQDVCWILAAMLLGSVSYNYGQPAQAQAWIERCLEQSQHLVEAPWVSLWPRINQAYYALGTQNLATVEHLFRQLTTLFTHQQDFPAHKYSVDIGLAQVVVAQGHLEHAKELLQTTLRHRQDLNIETYVIAETSLADIARQQGHVDEAHQRYWNMLVFCGQRSLLHLYCATALSFAELLHETQQTQGVADFLMEVIQYTDAAGYAELRQQCHTLLKTLHVSL